MIILITAVLASFFLLHCHHALFGSHSLSRAIMVLSLFQNNISCVFTVNFWRLDYIAQGLQLTHMFLALAGYSDAILVRFHQCLPHLKTIRCHIHMHLVV